MLRRLTSFVVVLGLLLAVPFAECLAMTHDQQSMKCCQHMPCNPANKAHDCCKKMVAPQVSSVLPHAHVLLSPPVAITAELLPLPPVAETETFRLALEPPQHSPPPLYILYAHLLI
jgi:hypothetical protein